MSNLKIGSTLIGSEAPVYFIAEIGSNHEGSLDKAKHLCGLAKAAGANCTKFQHYRADTLASRKGFEGLNLAHYTDNPYDVFKKYEVPWSWTPILKEYCDSIGIEFMSTPYDLEAVLHLESYVNAYKIGSGDITYKRLIEEVCATGKPIILSTGASDWKEVHQAISWVPEAVPLAVLQCNTNYANTAGSCLNLEVIPHLQGYYDVVTGLSDHTQSLLPVVAAVALGAKIIERHFTDNRITNQAPDTPFAMDPYDFKIMVEQIRTVEVMLGSGKKRVEDNEKETVVLQRRAIRLATSRPAGSILRDSDLVFLRPCPNNGLPPYRVAEVVGKALKCDIEAGDYLRETDLESGT